MTRPPKLPAPVIAARDFFRQEHDPAESPFASLGDNRDGLLIFVPGGLPSLNLQTVLQAVNFALTRPDEMSEFLYDHGGRS